MKIKKTPINICCRHVYNIGIVITGKVLGRVVFGPN